MRRIQAQTTNARRRGGRLLDPTPYGGLREGAFASDAGDIETDNAQIGKFTIQQFRQFPHGLAIEILGADLG